MKLLALCLVLGATPALAADLPPDLAKAVHDVVAELGLIVVVHGFGEVRRQVRGERRRCAQRQRKAGGIGSGGA